MEKQIKLYIDNQKKSNILATDLDLMYWSAIRYALGRRTYITSVVVDWTKSMISLINQYRKENIIKEIKDYLKNNSLDQCDRENWEKVLTILMGE